MAPVHRTANEDELAVASGQWLAANQPSRPVRIGLLLNPKAGRTKNARVRSRLAQLVPAPHVWEETHDLGSLRRALTTLLCTRAANVLGIVGGDGTVHHVVNALIGLRRELFGEHAADAPTPRLLLLNGGTLNIVGRTCAIHGPPHETLAKFLRYFDHAPVSRVPARRLPLLEVSWQYLGQPTPPRFGFVFGSEVAYHAIELYERFGAGYAGLLRFMSELTRGVLLGSELWQREGWKLGPYTTPLVIDGRSFADHTGAAACTVDLTLAIGAARAIRRQLYQPGFSVRVIEAMAPAELVRLIPAMMADRPQRGIVDVDSAELLRTSGPYTMDGELFHQPDALAERLPLQVKLADFRLHAVPGEWTADEW